MVGIGQFGVYQWPVRTAVADVDQYLVAGVVLRHFPPQRQALVATGLLGADGGVHRGGHGVWRIWLGQSLVDCRLAKWRVALVWLDGAGHIAVVGIFHTRRLGQCQKI